MVVDDRTDTLLRIAARLLETPDLSPTANFFAAGGDATLALRLLLDASSAGLHLTADQVRSAATIADLAGTARPTDESDGSSPTVGPIGLGLTPSWYLRANPRRVRYWNINSVVEAAAPLDVGALEAAMRAVAAQHDALRLRFTSRGDDWDAEVGEDALVEVRRASVRGFSPEEQGAALDLLMNDLQRAIHVPRGPLAMLAHVDRGAGEPPLVALTAAHLISDAHSQAVLLEDLEIAYDQVRRGVTVSLPPRPATLRGWTERLTELSLAPETDAERAVWLSEDRHTARPVPLDHPDGRNLHGTAVWLPVPLGRASTERLYRGPGRGAAGVLTSFLAALGTAYRAWTGQDRMLFYLLLHGRDTELHGLDLRRTVGCILHSYPALMSLPSGDRAMIDAVRAMRSSVPRQGLGYNLLRYLRHDPDLPRMPQPEIVINYRGRLAAAGAGLLGRREPGPSRIRVDPTGARPMVLELDAVVERGDLVMRWGFNTELHEPATIRALAEAHRDALAAYAEAF